MTKNYELTCLISAKTDEAERGAAIEKIKNIVKEKGGQNIESSPAKGISLGYPIKKQERGWFVVLNFQHENIETDKLKKEIEEGEEVLRCFLRAAPLKKSIPHTKTEPEREVRKEIKKEEKVELKDIDKKIEEIFNPANPDNSPKNKEGFSVETSKISSEKNESK